MNDAGQHSVAKNSPLPHFEPKNLPNESSGDARQLTRLMPYQNMIEALTSEPPETDWAAVSPGGRFGVADLAR